MISQSDYFGFQCKHWIQFSGSKNLQCWQTTDSVEIWSPTWEGQTSSGQVSGSVIFIWYHEQDDPQWTPRVTFILCRTDQDRSRVKSTTWHQLDAGNDPKRAMKPKNVNQTRRTQESAWYTSIRKQETKKNSETARWEHFFPFPCPIAVSSR